MIRLTEKQLAVLEIVAKHIAQSGLSPTMKEIGTAMGIAKVSVFDHVHALVDKGALTGERSKSRSYWPTPAAIAQFNLDIGVDWQDQTRRWRDLYFHIGAAPTFDQRRQCEVWPDGTLAPVPPAKSAPITAKAAA
jgi:SOS-response transcriptional repressor LexA